MWLFWGLDESGIKRIYTWAQNTEFKCKLVVVVYPACPTGYPSILNTSRRNRSMRFEASGTVPTINPPSVAKQPSVAMMCKFGLKFKKSPKVCTAITAPGSGSSKETPCLKMIPALIVKAEVYNPRTPRKNQYYRCVEAHFEELAGVWDDRFQRDYGYWRPYVLDVIYKYLDCGDLHLGFARVKCDDCQHEYLLPFSCKRRYFCPSCHQKRVLEFGEFLYTEVLKQVLHRQWVFSIPKRLRRYFMYDRSLLSQLSRCAWKVLSFYLKS